jgi:hypothetical protein
MVKENNHKGDNREMNSESNVKGFTPYHLFGTVSLIGIISFFLYALVVGAYAFDWLIMNNNGGWQFKDYFLHVFFMKEAKYVYTDITGLWGAFPPLIYIFYNLLYLLTARKEKVIPSVIEYQGSYYTLLVFLFYSIFLTLAFLYAVKLWQKHGRYRLLFICLLLSTPFFAGVYERGNSCLIVVILLLIALNWRDSESKIKRELALILIGVCAGIKIYPAIFGLLYLKEKRWKEAIRLIIYGIILFFGPFIFFLGKDGFILWAIKIIDLFKVECVGRVQFIKGLVCTISYLTTGVTNENIGSSVSVFFLLIMIFLSFISNNRSRTAFFLCAAMTFFPSNAFRYTLCYFAIPLIIELGENGTKKLEKFFPTLEYIFYGLVFTIPTYWGMATGFKLNFSANYPRATYVEVWIYLMAYILLAIMVFHELYVVVKDKNTKPSSEVC